jgi:hypothetical protein
MMLPSLQGHGWASLTPTPLMEDVDGSAQGDEQLPEVLTEADITSTSTEGSATVGVGNLAGESEDSNESDTKPGIVKKGVMFAEDPRMHIDTLLFKRSK